MTAPLISFRVRRQGEPYSALTEKYYGPALVHAINHTIERIQEHTRTKIPGQLNLRSAASKRLIRNLVSIDRDEFASSKQRRYRGVVGIKASVGSSEGVRRFAPRIVRFEFGGVETSRDGKPLYVPTRTLRPSPSARIRRDLYPKALGVLESRRIEGGESGRGFKLTKRGKLLIRGKRRTYAVDPRFHPEAPHGTHGVWQRRGRGRGSEIFLLWTYVRQIRYPRRFTFREDSLRIAEENIPVRLKAYLSERTIRSLVSQAQ